MEKKYIYNRYVIFFKYGILFAFFFGIFVMLLPEIIGWKSRDEFFYDMILYIFFFAFIFPIVIWIINISKVSIYVDEAGLSYSSLFKKIKIPWNNIISVEKRYYYSGAFPRGGPPRDIEILTNNFNNLKIYYFLRKDFQTSNNLDAIDELESDIIKYTNK